MNSNSTNSSFPPASSTSRKEQPPGGKRQACARCARRKIRCRGGLPCQACGLSNNICNYGSGQPVEKTQPDVYMRACKHCKRKKIKCSAEKPCESCNERGIECEVQSQPHLNPNPANSPLKYHYSLSYIKSKEQKTIALVAIPCENTSTNGLPPNHERKDPNTIFNGAPKFGAGFGIKPQSEVSLVVSQSPDAFSFHLPETRKTDTNFTYLCSMLIPNHGKQLIIWAPWSENKHGEGMLFYKDDGLSLRGVSFAQYPFRASESHTCSYGR